MSIVKREVTTALGKSLYWNAFNKLSNNKNVNSLARIELIVSRYKKEIQPCYNKKKQMYLMKIH